MIVLVVSYNDTTLFFILRFQKNIEYFINKFDCFQGLQLTPIPTVFIMSSLMIELFIIIYKEIVINSLKSKSVFPTIDIKTLKYGCPQNFWIQLILSIILLLIIVYEGFIIVISSRPYDTLK